MIRDNRIIFEDDTTLRDLSANLNKWVSGTETFEFVSADDRLYIGSALPFNHRYFLVSTVNSNASVVSVEIWDGDEWVAAKDVIDETDVSGVSLGQSGNISWTPDKDEFWSRDDTDDMTSSGIETLEIYNLYWARLTWSADFSASTALQFVGQKFSEDVDLGVYYPHLNTSAQRLKFNNGVSGKNDWADQHFAAAEEIIRILEARSDKIIFNRNQILRWDIFKEAAAHKVAEIIYNAYGDDKKDDAERARKYFDEAMTRGVFSIDLDADGRLDEDERFRSSSIVRR